MSKVEDLTESIQATASTGGRAVEAWVPNLRAGGGKRLFLEAADCRAIAERFVKFSEEIEAGEQVTT